MRPKHTATRGIRKRGIPMAVDVRKVTDRRKLRYSTLQDLVSDADRLATGQVRSLGNRSFEEILGHLILVMNGSIDGSDKPLRFPWYVRIRARLLRKVIFNRGLPAGHNLPPEADSKMWPRLGDRRQAIEDLRKAVRRLETETKRGSHPAFGKLTVAEWNQFHLRHSELHMSFVQPA
jgi:hypothetical protein